MTLARRSPASPSGGIIGAALLAAALAVWIQALRTIPRQKSGEYGLLATHGGVLLSVATALLIAGFLVAVATRRLITAAAAILVAVMVTRVTVPLVTEVPIYSWTFKHVGLVDYIMYYGKDAPAAVDIYTKWPGFFASAAWFSAVTGLDPVIAADWFGPVSHVIDATLIVVLARALGARMRAALVAAMLWELLNWVGQNYYSPQAWALIMATAMLTLLVQSMDHPMAGHFAIAVFAAVVASHQLTPVWLMLVVIPLAFARRLSPRWMPVALTAVVLAYYIPRRRYIGEYGSFFNANPLRNSNSNVSTRGSDGRAFTMLVDRALSASMWLLALLCLVLIWRKVAMPWAAAAIAFSAMLLLAGQNYGGEAVFRVFLYSLAGCSILIAVVLTKWMTASGGWRSGVRTSLAWFALVAMSLASLQGYYGGWSYITMSLRQLQQSRSLMANSADGTIITTIAPAGWPERPNRHYVRLALENPDYDKPLIFLKHALSRGFPTPADLNRIELIGRASGNPLYLVLPRQANTYSDYFGVFKIGAIPLLIQQLTGRPYWTKVIDDEDSVVFSYRERRSPR